MSRITFTVSARTARLIGRENIASSKGAIIELVKNGYDADSRVSIVYFDNQFVAVQEEISDEQYRVLVSKGVTEDTLSEAYKPSDNGFKLRENLLEEKKLNLKKELNKLNALYIIDIGEGMTQKIIRDHWMTIGTDNKASDIFTKLGRVKAGAKGIGRFALDKLGGRCEMITVFNPENHDLPDTDSNGNETSFSGYNWKVNWDDFEGAYKTINNVTAELNGINKTTFRKELLRELPDLDIEKLNPEIGVDYGTVLKISDLRDDWEDFYVNEVYSDLEVLVPPKEGQTFQIFLLNTLTPNKYGEVLGSVCDDFDYKLIASADAHQNVTIKVYRNEYDLEAIDPELFNRDLMQSAPYRKQDFKKLYWEKKMSFSQLLPGYEKTDDTKAFENIGIFEFSFFFMKKTFNTPDAKRFFNRRFMANARKNWLDKFGGIKLFRDDFRVRPYGETDGSSFDWLGLGTRKSSSPAGIAKEGGGWKVEPDNVAGSIKISRLTNVNFEDKSSREGLQENKIFLIFKLLLSKIISVFEEDRSYIAREMDQYHKEKYSDRIDREKVEKLAKSILDKKKERESQNEKDESKTEGSAESESSAELEVLAELNQEKNSEIEKLKDEQKVLRGLASSGIVLASFSHDLSKLNDVLGSRINKLRTLIAEKINEQELVEVEDRKNPFVQLEKMRKQDVKLQNWLIFSLGATRKDKRKRKLLFLHKYFKELKADWTTILENRGVEMDVTSIEQVDMRVFEIDFDSIFNNLLVNSVDAFKLSSVNRKRSISITVVSSQKEIRIEYYDSGPGLSSDIEKADKIFEPLFTTKRNSFTGEEEGTGLGMWLVKSIVHENDGQVKLLYPEIGFGLRVTFPIKYKCK